MNVEPDQVLFDLALSARSARTEEARGARRDRIRVKRCDHVA